MKTLVKRLGVKNQIGLWTLILCILFAQMAPVAATDNIIGDDGAVVSAKMGAVVNEVRVIIDAQPDRHARYAAMASRLIPIQAGDPLTDTAIQAAIDALKLSHRFSAIHVDSIPDSEGETLTFTLTPYRIIEDIRIRGKYPLFERDILNQMTLYPGDPYTQADLSTQTGAIIERYKREGYIDPQVSVKALRDPGNENAIILVDVDKGPHYVLGTLTFEGNRGVSSNALQRRMKVWWAALVPGIGRFSEYRLKKNMNSLLSYYRRKGFAGQPPRSAFGAYFDSKGLGKD